MGPTRTIVPEARKTILIIDDNPSALWTFSRIFEKHGFNITTARTGREAWEKLKRKSYDAALVDVKLPDTEGTDLLQRMGQLIPRMAKIVFTGSSLDEKSIATAKMNADALLLKPVKPEKLLAILQEKIEEKRALAKRKPALPKEGCQ